MEMKTKRLISEILLVIVCLLVMFLAFYFGKDPAGSDYWTL